MVGRASGETGCRCRRRCCGRRSSPTPTPTSSSTRVRPTPASSTELLARNGVPLGDRRSVLDLGCGCGRVARWWAEVEGPRFYGCDYNPKLAAWCEQNLPFLDARANSLAPPLPFAEERPFGLIYALSVFTHLTAELEREWLAEIRASLGEGDLFLFTVSGERYRYLLADEDAARFDRGELVDPFRRDGGDQPLRRLSPARVRRAPDARQASSCWRRCARRRRNRWARTSTSPAAGQTDGPRAGSRGRRPFPTSPLGFESRCCSRPRPNTACG